MAGRLRRRISNKGHKNSLAEVSEKMSMTTQNLPLDLDIGIVDTTDEMAIALHTAAWEKGKKSNNKLKNVIAKGIDVDFPNDFGQSPLFCACVANNENIASLLLQYGADPNFKDHIGVTPLLVVCYIGNIGLLCKMIEEGGDVCMRDNKDQGILEWASKNQNFEVRNAMVAFLEQTRIYGLMSSAHDEDIICDSKIPSIASRPLKRTSVMEVVLKTTGSDISVVSHESTGLGQVYPCAKESAAIVSIVPLLSEAMLINVNNVTFDCSLDFNMREMLWLATQVSVKTLNSEFEIKERATLILAEASFLSKLHHPNVILLMGLCQPNTLDMITLVLERVHYKNLYQYLHINTKKLLGNQCVTMAIELSSAMSYIHYQGYVHCGLSSMAVYLTNTLTVKLGNFEFMTERSQAEKGVLSSINAQRNIKDLCYWMSPELICGCPPAFHHDVFSFTCVIWEMFTAEVPWSWISKHILYEKAFAEESRELPVKNVPSYVRKMIETGLKRKESNVEYFKIVYAFFTKEKNVRNVSQNSLYDNSSLVTPCKNSAKGKSPPQDKLVFGSRNLHTQRRHFKSTSAITYNTDTGDGTRFDKNSSEGDLLLLKGSGFSQPAIKPASHHHQQEFMVKTCTGLCGPNIVLGDGRKTSNSSLDEYLTNDDEIAGKQKITCVKQLAEGYQQRIIQHKLRQAILKGSMAPQGSCQDGGSPLDHSRWCSLPSTIKELSKLWSSREESTKMCLSDIGNLSCTPQSKQTSTPLHRNQNKSHPSCVAVVDFFRRQRTLRNVGTNCRFDEMDLEQPEEDNTIKQKGNVLGEMKVVQTHWKRLIMDAEDQSSDGVSYHSPVIEFRKKKVVADNWNDTFLQTEDKLDGQSPSDCKNMMYWKVCEVVENEVINEEGNQGDESSKTDMSYELETSDRVVKVDGKRTVSFDEGVSNVGRGIDPAGQTKDSFWDVTKCTWPGKRSPEDAKCLKETMETTMCSSEGETDDKLMLTKSQTSLGVFTSSQDVNVSLISEENSKVKDNNDGNETNDSTFCVLSEDENENGDKVKDSTFCVLSEDENENGDKVKDSTFGVKSEDEVMDVNATFTLDAESTEPDSWFLDTAPSDGVSHWVTDQLDIIKHEMMTNDDLHEDDVRSVDSSKDNLHHDPSNHLLKIDSDIQESYAKCCTKHLYEPQQTGLFGLHQSYKIQQEAKNFEFEFQEFYIDDDFDTCEKIHDEDSDLCEKKRSVTFNESTSVLDSNACTRTAPGDSPPPPPPPLNLSTDRFDSINDMLDYKQSNSNPQIAGWKLCGEQNKSHSFSMPYTREEGTSAVKDRIVLFERSLSEKHLNTHSTQIDSVVTGKENTISIDKQKQTQLQYANTIRSSGDSNGSGSCPSLTVDIELDVAKEKNRLIPKMKIEEKKKSEITQSSCEKINKKMGKSSCLHPTVDSQTIQEKIEAGNMNKNSPVQLPASLNFQNQEMMISKDENSDDENDEHEDEDDDKKDLELKADPMKYSKTSVKESLSTHLSRPLTKYRDTDDCDSDEWLKEQLRNIQEKIRRRRQRTVYTISSDEDDCKEEENQHLPLQPSGTPHHQQWGRRSEPSEMWDFKPILHVDDDSVKFNTLSSRSGQVDQWKKPRSRSCTDYWTPKGKENDCLNEMEPPQGMTEDYNQSYYMPSSNPLDDGDGDEDSSSHNEYNQHQPEDSCSKNTVHTVTGTQSFDHSNYIQSRRGNKTDINSKKIPSKSLESVLVNRQAKKLIENKMLDMTRQHGEVRNRKVPPIPMPRSHGSVSSIRGNESRSSIKTVMFEDEADGLRQFTPRNFSLDNINSTPYSRDEAIQNRYESGHSVLDRSYGSDHSVLDRSYGNDHIQSVKRDIDTFDVTSKRRLEISDDKDGTSSDPALWVEKDVDSKRRHLYQRHKTCREDRCCVTVGLDHDNRQDNAGGQSDSKEKMCTIGDNVYTEVHRFYIPDNWPDGCKARLHMDLCPNNPRLHRMTTTAIDPVSGRQEVLMEKTVETDRLRSHLTME